MTIDYRITWMHIITGEFKNESFTREKFHVTKDELLEKLADFGKTDLFAGFNNPMLTAVVRIHEIHYDNSEYEYAFSVHKDYTDEYILKEIFSRKTRG
jgi:hypothetical protein